MKNKIDDLRNHLFETIERLKDGDMEIDKARAIRDVAQTLVNSAKVEVDFLRATESIGGSVFFDGVQDRPAIGHQGTPAIRN